MWKKAILKCFKFSKVKQATGLTQNKAPTRPISSATQNNHKPTVPPQQSAPPQRAKVATETMNNKKLKIPNVEDKLVSFILDEIIDNGPSVKFNDIGSSVFINSKFKKINIFALLVGQNKAKQALNELVILPAFNPGVSLNKNK